MSTPAELSAKLRAPSQRTQFNSAGELQTHEVYPSPYDIEIADALDALQAQVEVLRAVLEPARKAISDQVAYYGAGRDDFCLKVLSQLDAALSKIKASDADRREKP